MHGFRFLCEMALSHCSYRSIRIIHNLPPFASMVRSPAEMWSELLSLGDLIKDEPLASGVVSTSAISTKRTNLTLRLGCGSGHGRVTIEVKTPLLSRSRPRDSSPKVRKSHSLITIAQITRLQRAYRCLSMCFTSNRGGSHGIYAKSRRCPFVWFLAVSRAVQRGAGRASARALRRDEN